MNGKYQTYNWLFWALKASRLDSSQGLSLGEVLIASVVSSLFFLVSLQCALLGGQYQKQSLDTSQFNRLVQTDLEQSAQSQAGQYNLARLTADAAPGNATLSVSSVASFTNSDWLIFANDFNLDTVESEPSSSPPEEMKRNAYKIASVNSATRQITLATPIPTNNYTTYRTNTLVVRAAEPITTLRLNANPNDRTLALVDTTALVREAQLVIGNNDRQIYTITGIDDANHLVTINPPLKATIAQVAGTSVGTSRCAAKTSDAGFAAGLRNYLGISDDTPQTVTQASQYGAPYSFQRTMSIINQSPFNVLRVQYEVPRTTSNSSQTYTFTTDVIPSASLYCS